MDSYKRSDHNDVIKWQYLPRYWPFVRGIHRSPVYSPHKRPVTWSFDVFFDLRPNKLLSKQSWGWLFETPSGSLWRHCNDLDPFPYMCKTCTPFIDDWFILKQTCIQRNLLLLIKKKVNIYIYDDNGYPRIGNFPSHFGSFAGDFHECRLTSNKNDPL